MKEMGIHVFPSTGMVMGASCMYTCCELQKFVLIINLSVLTRISVQDDKKECIYALPKAMDLFGSFFRPIL